MLHGGPGGSIFLFSNFVIQLNSRLKPSCSFYRTCTHQELKTYFYALNKRCLNDHIRCILVDMCDLTNLYCVKASPTTADRCHNHLCQQKYYACQFQDATSFRILHSSGIFAETALYLVIIIINRRFCTHQLAKRVVPHSAESKMMHHLVF